MNEYTENQDERAEPSRSVPSCPSLLRWQISRIYRDGPQEEAGRGSAHVVVHLSSEEVTDAVAKRGLRRLRHGGPEVRSWWDRKQSIEGSVPEATLISELTAYPAADLHDLMAGPEERAVAEDMVLLQVLDSSSCWLKAVEVYAAESEDFPDLTELATSQGSRWLDITKSARRASKQHYRAALRGAQRREPDPSHGGHASSSNDTQPRGAHDAGKR